MTPTITIYFQWGIILLLVVACFRWMKHCRDWAAIVESWKKNYEDMKKARDWWEKECRENGYPFDHVGRQPQGSAHPVFKKGGEREQTVMEFEEALWRAFAGLMLTHDEVLANIEKFKREKAAAVFHFYQCHYGQPWRHDVVSDKWWARDPDDGVWTVQKTHPASLTRVTESQAS